MKKSAYTRQNRALLEALIEARKAARLTQQQVANRLGRPQSFVAKYEGGERRLDVIEFLEIVRLLGADPHDILDAIK